MVFLNDIINAHGTLENWNRYNRVLATLSFGGLAFQMKFNNKGIKERRYIISLENPMVVIENYPNLGQQGVFTSNVVWVEDFKGKKLKEREHPRSAMKHWQHHYIWDDLDLLYFAGYACWNYFNMPFLFVNGNFEIQNRFDGEEGGQKMQGMEVIYPNELPAHCKKQTCYFDEQNRLYRFDYEPEVFASWAKAAHYCYDYRAFNGIWLPTRRKVVPRNKNGKTHSWPTLVWIAVRDAHFQ